MTMTMLHVPYVLLSECPLSDVTLPSNRLAYQQYTSDQNIVTRRLHCHDEYGHHRHIVKWKENKILTLKSAYKNNVQMLKYQLIYKIHT